MPYVLISTQIRMEVGPTMVGDEHSDPNLMQYLGATKRNMLGNHFVRNSPAARHILQLVWVTTWRSLDARLVTDISSWLAPPAFLSSWEYYVQDAPRIVLDKLEKRGYRVISMTGVGQTLVWCLHKESTENSDFLSDQDIAVNRPA